MLRLTGVREDRGAVAMIVAMLFGFGVMIGLAALTIDVGNINADRRQLQNGADAVALAIAQECASGGTCDSVVSTKLQNLADSNAADGYTDIKRVGVGPAICGNVGDLTPCPELASTSLSNLQECPSEVADDLSYVRVYTETKNSEGNILPYYFGEAITGIRGANQQACATVTYGPPSGAAAPITLSYCEWAAATGYVPPLTPGGDPVQPGDYYPDPVYPDPVELDPGYGGSGQPGWPAPADPLPAYPVPGGEIIIQLQGSHATTCDSWNGHDVPGGFGYLSTSTSCATTAAVGGWIKVDTGNTLPSSCGSLLPYLNTIIYLPVFDCVATGTVSAPPSGTVSDCASGNGANTWYHIQGYAKFFLSGYKVGGSEEAQRSNPLATPRLPCDNPDRCLSGWFLEGLVDAPPAPPPPPGTPLLGAYSITLAG